MATLYIHIFPGQILVKKKKYLSLLCTVKNGFEINKNLLFVDSVGQERRSAGEVGQRAHRIPLDRCHHDTA